MRVPVADPRSEILIGRPHVGEAHTSSLGKFAFRIGGLHTFGDLVWILTPHSELRSQFVRVSLPLANTNVGDLRIRRNQPLVLTLPESLLCGNHGSRRAAWRSETNIC